MLRFLFRCSKEKAVLIFEHGGFLQQNCRKKLQLTELSFNNIIFFGLNFKEKLEAFFWLQKLRQSE